MNHAITLADVLRALGGLLGGILILAGILMFMAGAMSDASAEGDKSGRQGCACSIIGLILIAIMLAACQHTPEARVETVEVKVPVAVQPITKDQVPPLPGQLGPRPNNARDAADVALAGRCEAIAFVIRAYPLLLLSAGLPPAQAPDYPECDKP